MSSQFDLRVYRGGSWYHGVASDLAARARYWYAPSNRDSVLGFRCVRAESGGSFRVIRGGSWFNVAARCRAAYRYHNGPSGRYDGLGLRVVRRDG